jgi:hypothetical protein
VAFRLTCRPTPALLDRSNAQPLGITADQDTVDFLSAVKIMLRRWFVVVPALLATAGGAFAMIQAVAPAYEAKGAVLMLPPAKMAGAEASDEPVQINPFLDLGGSLYATADVAAQVIMSDAVARELAEDGAVAAYEVMVGQESPTLTVIATGASSEEAIRTVDLVTERVQRELAERQHDAGAPAESLITADVISAPDEAKALLGSKIRAGAGVVALGSTATVSLGFLAESIAVARRRRRQSHHPSQRRQPHHPERPERVAPADSRTA